ncbi:hypothetical protein D3C81_1894250 [compost metagenome]
MRFIGKTVVRHYANYRRGIVCHAGDDRRDRRRRIDVDGEAAGAGADIPRRIGLALGEQMRAVSERRGGCHSPHA